MESLCANSIVTYVYTVAYFLRYSQLFCHNFSAFTKHQSVPCSVTALRKGNCACFYPYTVSCPYVPKHRRRKEREHSPAECYAVCFGHFQGECYSFGEVLLFIRRVRISSEKRLFPSTDLSVCPSAYIGATTTARIFVKFDIGDFHENLSRKIQMWLKSDNNIRHFTWRL
jgi:hypothetical protein